MARNLAQVFVQNVYSSWKKSDIIYEKYNCEEPGGGAGGGGEYEVQEGFGWTNGVTMYLLSKYVLQCIKDIWIIDSSFQVS